jgi:hypothetical protein
MAHRTVRCATGHCPVRQPRHQAVGFRPLELWLLGPPGCPVAHRTCTVECPVRHFARDWLLRALARIKWLCRWPLARSSRCSAGSPDSPVRHRTLSGAPATSPGRWVPTVGALTCGPAWLSGVPPARALLLSARWRALRAPRGGVNMWSCKTWNLSHKNLVKS